MCKTTKVRSHFNVGEFNFQIGVTMSEYLFDHTNTAKHHS